SFNWCYGPGNPLSGQYDFESVTLHEIGHSHMLNHVINTNDVLHYALTIGQTRRVLNWGNVQGGNYVINLGQAVAANCGLSPMALFYDATCPMGIEEEDAGDYGLTVFPNPASGLVHLNLSHTLKRDSKIEVFNVIGEKFPVALIGENTMDVSSL